jgi:hypothetical protein
MKSFLLNLEVEVSGGGGEEVDEREAEGGRGRREEGKVLVLLGSSAGVFQEESLLR